MSWVLLTILAIVSRAVFSVAIKILSEDVKVSAITHSILLTTVAGLISLIISPFLGGISFTGIEIILIPTVVMILSQAFGNVLFFKGIKYLDAGTSQIAFSSILIWGAILSVLFLDTNFSFKQIIGILLMLGAILLIQYRKRKLELNKGFIYIVVSAVLFAAFQVSSAEISKVVSTGTYLVLAYLAPSMIIGLIYSNKLIQELVPLRNQIQNTFIKTLFVSGTSVLYFIFSYIAYKLAPDRGVVVVLLTAQVVLSVLFGIIFLKERDNRFRKLIAGGLAFLAGILIKS